MFPPLKGTCIGIYDYYQPVQCNRWCECGITFVLLQDGGFFYIKNIYFIDEKIIF